MSVLASTQAKLLETDALLAKEERALADNPNQARLILSSIRSLQKIRTQLEAEFAEAANRLGRDICKYRMFSDEGVFRVPYVTTAVSDFQNFVTVVYDAIKNGPKERGRVGVDSLQESSFEIAYSFRGSLGFALTIPNERMLLDEVKTNLDDSMSAVCQASSLATSRDTGAVAQFAKKYGNASVRAMRKWAEWHVKTGLGAEIRWERNKHVRSEMLIQQPELLALQQTIDSTSEEQVSMVEVVGMLTKVDLPNFRFKIEVEGADKPLEGKFAEAIDQTHAAKVPWRYRAFIAKTTKTHFATEQDEETYFLMRIEPMD